MTLTTRSYTGHAMGTEVKLLVVTNDKGAGEEALRRAVCDLEETEQALSRFREDSDLSILNREGRAQLAMLNDEGRLRAGWRLLMAIRAAIDAYEWSNGLLDPRIIGSLEAFGYRKSLPREDVGSVAPAVALGSVDMSGWIDETNGTITLPQGVRLDLAGVGKALGIGWAAHQLAGHAGLLVDVGGDVLALGHDEHYDPWRVAVKHERMVGEFSGHALAVATSTTVLRAWKTNGRQAHHLIDPRTGAPSEGELLYATVAAPTILEADLAAKLLVIGGEQMAEHLDESFQAVLTDRHGHTRSSLGGQPMEVGA
ncbi:MAG TPA: FAD:protein FMN transferase [Rubrobacter sp.]|nr:FAD:protein FMN transferase [Rubrobacter sp.]